MSLWDENFWLPKAVSWNDLESNSTFHYPKASELQYTILAGLILTVLRLAFECLVFLPIGIVFGWVDTSKESTLTRIGQHLRNNKTKFKRVAETAWRFLYYTIAFFVGYFVLRDEPQLQNVDECWRDWPHQHVGEHVWWYYTIETGFYWSLLFTTFFFDVKRSDFWQMTVHHLITILLLGISFSINFVRVGTLILFSHDAGDILIELGKLFRYANWEKMTAATYVVFMVIWIATRLIYYPFWVIYSVLFTAPGMIQDDYRWEHLTQRPIVPRILVFMLVALVALHVFWTYVLIMIAVKSTTVGKIDDIREDSDEEEVDRKKAD